MRVTDLMVGMFNRSTVLQSFADGIVAKSGFGEDVWAVFSCDHSQSVYLVRSPRLCIFLGKLHSTIPCLGTDRNYMCTMLVNLREVSKNHRIFCSIVDELYHSLDAKSWSAHEGLYSIWFWLPRSESKG